MLAIAGGIILGWLGVVALMRLMLAHDARKLKRALAPAPPIEPRKPIFFQILGLVLAGALVIAIAIAGGRPYRPDNRTGSATAITVNGPGGITKVFPPGTDDATINSVMERATGFGPR